MGNVVEDICSETSVDVMTINFPKVRIMDTGSLPLDSNQRREEVRVRLNEVSRRASLASGLGVLVVNLDRSFYFGIPTSLDNETYSLQTGDRNTLHVLNNLRYADVGALFYVSIE